MQFASYLSKSEPGLLKLHYFSNTTNKCGLLVTRQKNDNIFAVKQIDKPALPQTERRFFTVCFCSYDKGVLLFVAVAMAVNTSIKQQQSLKNCIFLFAFKTSFSYFSVFKLHRRNTYGFGHKNFQETLNVPLSQVLK